jgi:mono/diheme cytochrome c family protein
MGIHRILCIGTFSVFAAFAVDFGDPRHGAELFESEGCVKCHSVNGKGGSTAPDLGKRVDRNYTPAVMASLMWNHAPAMWSALKAQGIVKATLPPESAADLFAYFYSARAFEKPGDAGRGKQAFTSKRCAECHGITNSISSGAPAVVNWESLSDPIALAQQMWNHSVKMREAFAQKHIAVPQITSQDLSDILVYLQNAPETRNLAARPPAAPGSGEGQALFASKCSGCHTGNLALEKRLKNQTLTDIAVDMWNHSGRMKPMELSQGEMRQILGYVWARQFSQAEGSSVRGKKVFAEKKCTACHEQGGGAPSLAKGRYNDITMVSALWEHGPRMLDRMKEKNVSWPRFTAAQMTDLIAYLNSLQ